MRSTVVGWCWRESVLVLSFHKDFSYFGHFVDYWWCFGCVLKKLMQGNFLQEIFNFCVAKIHKKKNRRHRNYSGRLTSAKMYVPHPGPVCASGDQIDLICGDQTRSGRKHALVVSAQKNCAANGEERTPGDSYIDVCACAALCGFVKMEDTRLMFRVISCPFHHGSRKTLYEASPSVFWGGNLVFVTAKIAQWITLDL